MPLLYENTDSLTNNNINWGKTLLLATGIGGTLFLVSALSKYRKEKPETARPVVLSSVGLGLAALLSLPLVTARPPPPPPPGELIYKTDFENPDEVHANWNPIEGNWESDFGIIPDPADPSNHVLAVRNAGKRIYVGDFNWRNYMIDVDLMFYCPDKSVETEPVMSWGMYPRMAFMHKNYDVNQFFDSLSKSYKIGFGLRDAQPFQLTKTWGEGAYQYQWGVPSWAVYPNDPVAFYFAGPEHLRWYHIRLIPSGSHFYLYYKLGKGKTDLQLLWDKLDYEHKVWDWDPSGVIGFGYTRKETPEDKMLIDNLEVTKIVNPEPLHPPDPFTLPTLFETHFNKPEKQEFAWGGIQWFSPGLAGLGRNCWVADSELHLRYTPGTQAKYGSRSAHWNYYWFNGYWRSLRITNIARIVDDGAGRGSSLGFCEHHEYWPKVNMHPNKLVLTNPNKTRNDIHPGYDKHTIIVETRDLGGSGNYKVFYDGNPIWEWNGLRPWGGVTLGCLRDAHAAHDYIKIEKI